MIRLEKTKGENMVDLGMLVWISLALAVILLLVALHGAITVWRSGNKFLGFIFFAMAVVVGFFIYAMFGQRIAGLFQ